MCDILSATMQRNGDFPLLKYANTKRSQGRFNDVTIKTRKKLISANRLVLSCYSKYFETMFETEMKEKYENVVELESVDQDSLEILIEFIYTGMIKIDENNVKSLFSAADYLLIDDVKEYCFEFLGSSITTDNCLSVLKTSFTYESNSLTSKVYYKISRNFNTIATQTEFLNLDKQMFLSCISNTNREDVDETSIYNAIISWLKSDLELRKPDLVCVFSLINLNCLSIKFLIKVILNEDLIKEDPFCLSQLQRALEKNIDQTESCKKINCFGGINGSKVVLTWNSENLGESRKYNYPELPIKTSFHNSIVANNSIYLFGGRKNILKETSQNIWKLNLNKKFLSWQLVSPNQITRILAGATSYKNCIVIAGGASNNLSKIHSSSHAYNDLFDQWKPLSNLKEGRYGNALVACDDILFCLGGRGHDSILSSVEKLNHFKGQWEFVNSMLTPRMWVAAVNCQNVIYAIGGRYKKNTEATLKSVEKYDPTNKKWTLVCDMNIERSFHSACVLEDKIYVIGGMNNAGDVIKEIECYDVTLDQWSIVGKTNDEWCYHASVTI